MAASLIHRGSRSAALSLIAVLGAVVFMLWPMQRATFGLIDDHQIVGLLGPDRPAGLVEALARVPGMIQNDLRFRPGFWALWMCEFIFADGDPRQWYLDRILLAALAAGALFRAVLCVVPALPAGLATLLFFCGFQNEFWMRLKLQEAYAAPLLLVGIAVVATRLAAGRTSPVALLPGYALIWFAGLLKESFVPALPALLVMVHGVAPTLWPGTSGAPLRRRDHGVLGLLAAATLLQVAMVWWILRLHGHVYAESLSATGVFVNAATWVWLVSKDSGWFFPTLAGLLFLVVQARRGNAPSRDRLLRHAVLLFAAAVVWLGPQWLVYGAGAVQGRYLVPGNLFCVFAAAIGLRLLHSPAAAGGRSRLATLLLFASQGTLGYFVATWIARDHAVAQQRAAFTWRFQSALDDVAALKMQDPARHVVFRTEDPWDLEHVQSVRAFLDARLSPPGRYFLMASDARRDPPSPLEARLLASLQHSGIEGDLHFRPLAERPVDRARCVEVTFRAAPKSAACDRRVQVPFPE